ncbi:MAG: acyl--CoA ligase [Firmicutes bacterium]|nr:acyl--CoA ligase [Bacillota bacterium]
MQRLSDLFYDSAAANPDKPAIWCDGKVNTYRELAELVSRYANLLLHNGVKYKDHLGIPMNNSIESVALIFAAANIGAAIVPINPTLPVAAAKTTFQAGDVKHLIARKSFYEECEKFGGINIEGICVCLDGTYPGTIPFSAVQAESAERPEISGINGDETLILTMTSGSTGTPKPIDLTQNNKYLRAIAHIRMYNITTNDRVLAATPLYHSLAERLVIMPLIIGATSILLPRFTPEIWLNCVREQQVTFTIAVSAQLAQVAELLAGRPEVESLRCIVSSSALLEPLVREKLINKLHCDFHEMYGTSETSTITSINFKEALNKQTSVGGCIPGAQVQILLAGGEIAGINEIGEIACQSPLICNGYYGLEDVFNQALAADGYFKTGDLGYLDQDGYLYFSGRKKELIITGGINVYPSDVEKCVLEMPAVSECAAFAYPDQRLGEVVALAVRLKPGLSLRERMVQVHCARNLADFQQPHKIFFVDELPRNAMGKIMKTKLAEYVRS